MPVFVGSSVGSCCGHCLRPTKSTCRQKQSVPKKNFEGAAARAAFQPPRFPFLSPPLCYLERTTSVRKRQPFLRLHWIPLSGCIFPFLPHDLRCANWVHTALGTQRHWERMCHAFRPIGPTTRRRCQAHTAMAHAPCHDLI